MAGKIIHGDITNRAVEALRPGETLKDAKLSGFQARARQGATSYSVLYRAGRGRAAPQKRYTIGPHGSPWTATTARDKAKLVLGEVAHGKDPARARAEEKAAPLVADLAAKFLAEEVETKCKASTAREYRRLLNRIVLPELGKKRVADVTRQDIQKFHHAHRAAPGEANMALTVASIMFNFAERIEWRPSGSNPCRHIERYRRRRYERFLSADELGRLGAVLAAFDGAPYAVAAIRLLIFTGARRSEVLGLRWDWIDFERGEARLPDSKTGAKTLHLPPPAVAVLAELPRVEGNPHVIVGGKPGAALANLEKPWRSIRKASGLDDVRLHDLRHGFASVAVASGMGLPIIGKMLGHSQPATTARYAHLASDPVKAAAAAVAGKIAAAMSAGTGTDQPAAVVDMHKRPIG
jgi:integrase